MATRDEVGWLYRCLLNREPENAAAIEAQLPHDFQELRAAIMLSREFVVLTEHGKNECLYAAPNAVDGKIALACIVRNEEHNIERMLSSCFTLASYIVVIDTGSEDRTVSLTRQLLRTAFPGRHTLRTIEFKDFGSARNTAIEAVPASCDWILMLDADEHLVPEDLHRFRALVCSDVDAWHLPRFNFLDANKELPARPYPDHQCRLFRNRKNIQFIGHVHERLRGMMSEAFAPASNMANRVVGGPHIHHMGQVGLTQEAWQRKHDFYTQLSGK